MKDIFIPSQDLELDRLEAPRFGFELHPEVQKFLFPQHLDNIDRNEVKQVGQWVQTHGKRVSLHGPFFELFPFSLDPKVAALARERYLAAAEMAATLRAEFLIFHSQFNPLIKMDRYIDIWLQGTAKVLREALEVTADAGTIIAVENMWEPDPDHLMQLTDHVADPRLGVCLDVGHVGIHSSIPCSQWVRLLGSKIVYMHLHENTGKTNGHMPLGSGSLDLEELLREIGALNPVPTLCVEVLPESVDASLRELRRVLDET